MDARWLLLLVVVAYPALAVCLPTENGTDLAEVSLEAMGSTLSHSSSLSAAEDVASASNTFANNLYKKILSISEGNQLICPISLHVALALVHEGADGNTAQQLANVIGISGANSDIKQGYKTMLRKINDNTLKIATKLYPAKGFQLNSTFAQVAKDYYFSGFEELDYNNPTQAAYKINEDVEKSSDNKIHNLISPDSLDRMTKLVLVNAVHFQAKWRQPLSSTYGNEYFWINERKRVMAKLMHKREHFLYKDDPVLKAKVLQMDYDVGNYSMLFILPNKEGRSELSKVEESLSKMSLQDVLKGLDMTYVEAIIPSFTIQQTIDLKVILQEMGVTDLFTENADLKKVANGNGDNLYVNKVIQKTFINVHEAGTEAIADTGLDYHLRTISEDFRADRPFHFMLTNSKLVLFKGCLVDPSKATQMKRKRNHKLSRRVFNLQSTYN